LRRPEKKSGRGFNHNIYNLSKSIYILWSWLYDSWFYSHLCNQCLSPLMLWVWILLMARCTALFDKVCQWLATGWWFSMGTLDSTTI